MMTADRGLTRSKNCTSTRQNASTVERVCQLARFQRFLHSTICQKNGATLLRSMRVTSLEGNSSPTNSRNDTLSLCKLTNWTLDRCWKMNSEIRRRKADADVQTTHNAAFWRSLRIPTTRRKAGEVCGLGVRSFRRVRHAGKPLAQPKRCRELLGGHAILRRSRHAVATRRIRQEVTGVISAG